MSITGSLKSSSFLEVVVKTVLFFTWMLPLNLVGGLLFLIAKVLGQVQKTTGGVPQGFQVQLRVGGWLAGKMRAPTPDGRVLAANTIGAFIFFYVDAAQDLQLVVHESRHIEQQLYFGPLHWVIYAVSFVYGLVKYKDRYKAYRNVIWEKDARKAAGES